ncbi:uncharacterized protein [Leuresthes tenuis]|uniref:uncharacterized protein n=1 Tax=Leuresthes tenuis TaxID=355514 RepID=UPI003B506AE9
MFRRSPKPAETAQIDQDQQSLPGDLSGSNDNLADTHSKEKGFFSGILRKSPKIIGEGTPEQDKESLQAELSASNENLSEKSETKEKGGVFSSMFRKSPKLSEGPRLKEGAEPLHGELSVSSDNLLESKEKGGLFSGLLRKTPKAAGEENLLAHKDVSGSSDSLSDAASTKEKKSQDDELSGSREGLADTNTKEKGGIFSGIFKKPPKSAEAAQSEEDGLSETELSASNENLSGNKQEKGRGLFSGLLKKTPKASGEKTEALDREELSDGSEDLSENTGNKEKNIFSNMFKRPQKPAEGATAEPELEAENKLSGSSENLIETTGQKEKKGGLAGIFKRSSSFESLLEEDKNIFSGMFKKSPKTSDEEPNEAGEYKKLSTSAENLLEAKQEKTGGLAGIFKKSPKPSPRSIAAQDPLSDSKQLSDSCDSLNEIGMEDELFGSSTNNLLEPENTTKEKKVGFSGMFRRTPKTSEQQEGEDMVAPVGGGLRRKRTIKKKRRVVSFRIKKTLPRIPKLGQASQDSDMPLIEESVELQDLNAAQESTVEVQPVEMASFPTEGNPVETEPENDELMEWWSTVKGWTEWTESSNFQEGDGEMAMEQAADRVYMAARLFVRLFNQRGASLQQRILELLSLADAADQFHKRTVTAAVGGGVASVAGSVATITGLILAPFTFGASIIVTAVGISVATAGSIASATANITDTVHSNMDRKKVEKMIQGYQEEIKDIRECMEFVQEGMDTLQEWDFEKYSQSAAKKALNHNIKHVMKEGGRAGKALMINTDKLISTVQVLGAAGGAAKAAQAISVTTGVMSALFLALDVFFLAKDSHELRKGAKTKFAGKIREVSKDLQDGLLELNKVKTQLQKTMDGIEVEEYEEIEEVEVEVEDDLESDPKKLAELEQELDILEEKLDKKEEVEPQKSKEPERGLFKLKKDKKEEKSVKEKAEQEEKKEKEKTETNAKEEEEGKHKSDSKLKKIPDEKKQRNDESSYKIDKEVVQEQSQKGSKKEKETENRLTAGKEKKHERKPDKTKEDTGADKMTDGKEKERNKSEKEKEGAKSRSGDSKRDDRSLKAHTEWDKRDSERRSSSKEDEGGTKVERKQEKEAEGGRHGSRSDKDGERGGKHETRERDERGSHHKDKGSDRSESWLRKGEEERGVKDWRAEMMKSRKEEKRGNKETERENHRSTGTRKESHRGHEEATARRERLDRDSVSSKHESVRSHQRAGPDEHRERGEERHGSRVESARRRFETAGGEEEEEERPKRRGSDREHHHSRRGSRLRSNALREEGLNI